MNMALLEAKFLVAMMVQRYDVKIQSGKAPDPGFRLLRSRLSHRDAMRFRARL